MPVTRSKTTVARGKVHQSSDEQPRSGSYEDKQNQNNDTATAEDMADRLPKTVNDAKTLSSEDGDESPLRTRTALLLLLLIFASSLSALAFVYYSFPQMEPDEVVHVKFPKGIEDAKQLGLVLSRYTDRYFIEVLGGVFVTYLFLQTFAIPGSIFLSIVSGYLFPFPLALLLICFCSSTGASFCYLLSYLVGRRLVRRYLPEKAANWARKVEKHKDSLLSYIIFLRITPFLPNWFINIVSPVINVHLKPFWIGTFIGVAPPSFIAIQAGTTLQQLTSTTDALSFQSVALLVIFAFLSILPVLLKNRKEMKGYFSGSDDDEVQSKDEKPQEKAVSEAAVGGVNREKTKE